MGNRLENNISDREAAEADVVIFAADVALKDENRFSGKPILKVEVQKAIFIN